METYNILINLDSNIFKRVSDGDSLVIRKIFEKSIKKLNGKIISFYLMIGGEFNCATIIELEDKTKLGLLILELKRINYLDNYKVYSMFSESEFKKFIKSIKV